MVQTTMNLELVKFINSDLTWNAVKKGHRSTMRRPRKPATSSSDFGFASANKMQESIAFDYEKSGVAILGQHFADEVLDFPIKKRILKLQSPSLTNERARSAQSELPLVSKQVCHSMKSKNGSNSIDQSKSIEKVVPDLNDFSGIELLAAAACHSSVSESPSAVEEHTPPIVEPSTNGVKDDIAPIDSEDNDSSVQDSVFPVTQTLCDDVNGGEEVKTEISVPSKDIRLHWDLNTSMDEWEEPCCDILVDPHSEKGYSKDGLQSETTNTESQQVKPDFDPSSKSDGGRQAVSEVVQGDKVTSDDRLSDCCGPNTVDKVKAGGYDSPAEDGELRDTWQKNEVEEEMECVDYESDNIYEDNFDTIESINKEAMGALSAVSVLPNNEIQQEDKKNPPSISNQLPEHSQSAISEEKGRTPSFGLHKNDSCIRRSRSENIEDSFSRGKRDFGQEKSTVRNGPSYPCRGWDSRNTHKYPSRPKHVIGGSSMRDTHPISYNSRSTYTRPERNESYGVHRGISRDKYKSGLGFSKREEHSERKVSSFSSNSNRGAHKRRSRSRSRSRSESPIAWNFQKKRNVETKKESPNYNVNGQYRDTRASTPASRYSNYKYDLGRLKSSESDQFYPNSHSGRYPSHTTGQYDDEKCGGGRFRYYHVEESFKTRNKDNGFRYTRNESRYFKDPIHKDDLQRE